MPQTKIQESKTLFHFRITSRSLYFQKIPKYLRLALNSSRDQPISRQFWFKTFWTTTFQHLDYQALSFSLIFSLNIKSSSRNEDEILPSKSIYLPWESLSTKQDSVKRAKRPYLGESRKIWAWPVQACINHGSLYTWIRRLPILTWNTDSICS